MAGKRRVTLARVRNVMARLDRSIRSLTEQQLKKGKAISYGLFVDPGPNTNPTRFPATFSGGN